MSAFDSGLWPYGQINWGNALTASLKFLFVPSKSGYYDLVRGDRMNLGGNVRSTSTPFGRAWILGNPASQAGGGWATTKGNDTYYQPTVIALSMVVGAFNAQRVTVAGSQYRLGQWTANETSGSNSADGTGCLVNRITTNAGQNNFQTFAGGSGGTGSTIFGGNDPGSDQYITAGNKMTVGSTWNGTSLVGYVDATYAGKDSNTIGFATNSAGVSRTPASLGRVTLGDWAGEAPGRAITFCAGWNRILSSAEMQQIFNPSSAGVIGGLVSSFVHPRARALSILGD